MPKIYLCYRRSDSLAVLGRIQDRLVQKFGQDLIFKDLESIPLGKDFRAEMMGALAQCEVVLALIGPTWLSCCDENQTRRIESPQDYVRQELEFAFERRIRTIPLLVLGASPPQPDELPESLNALAYLQCMTIRSDPDFESDMARLISALTPLSKPQRLSITGTGKIAGCSFQLALALGLLLSVTVATFWALRRTPAEIQAQARVAEVAPEDLIAPATASNRNLALIVGVTSYEQLDLPEVKNAENDAKAIAQELKAQGFQTTTVVGQDATKSKLDESLAAFQAECKKLSPDDTVVIFFSGHGASASDTEQSVPERTTYFYPVDADPDKPNTALNLTEYFERLSEGKQKNLVFWDSHKSGKVTTNPTKSSDFDLRNLPQNFAVLASAQEADLSSSSTGEHGVFTQTILEGLRGAAQTSSGQLTMQDLSQYVIENNKGLSNRATLSVTDPNALRANLAEPEPYRKLVSSTFDEYKKQLNEKLGRRAYEDSLRSIDDRLLDSAFPAEKIILMLTKVDIALAQKDSDAALTYLRTVFKLSEGRATAIAAVCSHLYDQSVQQKNYPVALLQAAVDEASKLLESSKGIERARLLSSLAHLTFALGDKTRSLDFLNQAIAIEGFGDDVASKRLRDKLQSQ